MSQTKKIARFFVDEVDNTSIVNLLEKIFIEKKMWCFLLLHDIEKTLHIFFNLTVLNIGKLYLYFT